jgi:hypothetical protein
MTCIFQWIRAKGKGQIVLGILNSFLQETGILFMVTYPLRLAELDVDVYGSEIEYGLMFPRAALIIQLCEIFNPGKKGQFVK